MSISVRFQLPSSEIAATYSMSDSSFWHGDQVIVVDPKAGKYDPRGIANIVLDLCEMADISVSNLKLQKLLYFIEGWHSATVGRPLIDAEFEAWQHGPVLSIVYQSFKRFGSEQIDSRAKAINLSDGSMSRVKVILPDQTLDLISFVIARYGRLAPMKLVELSHIEGGPWHSVVSVAPSERRTSRISTESISSYFKSMVGASKC